MCECLSCTTRTWLTLIVWILRLLDLVCMRLFFLLFFLYSFSSSFHLYLVWRIFLVFLQLLYYDFVSSLFIHHSFIASFSLILCLTPLHTYNVCFLLVFALFPYSLLTGQHATIMWKIKNGEEVWRVSKCKSMCENLFLLFLQLQAINLVQLNAYWGVRMNGQKYWFHRSCVCFYFDDILWAKMETVGNTAISVKLFSWNEFCTTCYSLLRVPMKNGTKWRAGKLYKMNEMKYPIRLKHLWIIHLISYEEILICVLCTTHIFQRLVLI